ncbi:MAG: hypothetical protein R2849_00910 [Thermomicrobiales bacterium]
MPELLNIQPSRGEAKPYQIRQFLDLVERYNLQLGPTMRDYHINVFYSDEDQATLPTFRISDIGLRRYARSTS